MTLVELLIYAPIFLLVVGLAFGCFYEAQTRATHLRRFTEHIQSALLTGNQWRAAVRAAGKAVVSHSPTDDSSYLELIHEDSTNVFLIAEREMFRWEATRERWIPVMSRLVEASFVVEERGDVEVVRLEIALPPLRKGSKRPALLSFQAVPSGGATQ